MENNSKQNTELHNSNATLLTALFPNRQSTLEAIQLLHERGYSNNDISIIMSVETRDNQFINVEEEPIEATKVVQGLSTGSAIGGGVGAVVGIVAAIASSLVIPGIGLVIAGPIAAGLAGAGAGGIAGGLIGGLAGTAIPETDVEKYEAEIKTGGVILGIHPRNEEDAEYFREISHNNINLA
jgi:hypothetical protein